MERTALLRYLFYLTWNVIVRPSHEHFQSDFATPCIPISKTNATINGFDSGPRPAVMPPTELRVPIDASNNGTPIFYYDSANGSCGMGGVGVINVNESSPETLDGFIVGICFPWTLRSSEILKFVDAAKRRTP